MNLCKVNSHCRCPYQRNHRSTCNTTSVLTAKKSRNGLAFFPIFPAAVPKNIQATIRPSNNQGIYNYSTFHSNNKSEWSEQVACTIVFNIYYRFEPQLNFYPFITFEENIMINLPSILGPSVFPTDFTSF